MENANEILRQAQDDNLLKDLNPEQLAGVTHEQGPLLIVAGAGTGMGMR